MFHGKNVDFAELISEDFQYQIDYKQSKLRRHEIMPYPRFTKIIINYFLSLHKSVPKGLSSSLNTIKDDGVIKRLKFVNKGKKQTVAPKKKGSISADENIIPEPYVAFELGKSISRTEAKIAEEAKRVHETHERLKKSLDQSQKLKGIQVLTEEEQLATDTMQAIKSSKIVSRSQPHTRGSSKGAGITPEVFDESIDKLKTLSEGAGITPKVPDEVKGSSAAKANTTIDWGSENESDQSNEEKVNEEEIE
ncbi:hypothetical protein Tco_0420425 [Tanacetum coccineum]